MSPITRTTLVLSLATVLGSACAGGDRTAQETSSPEVTETTTAPTSPATTETTTAPAEPTPNADTGTPQAGACSAAGMDTSMFTENPDLTGAANETRRAIAEEAVDCDYAGLAQLAGEDFSYSFGDSGDAAGYWQRLEEEGEPVLRTLVTLLELDAHVEEQGDDPASTTYTWPRAYRGNGEEARDELEEAFGAEVVDGWYGPEGEYLGWRVGIRGDGTWLFYVAGD